MKNIRRTFHVDNVNDWMLNGKKKWNEHIDRIGDERFVKIARYKSLAVCRDIGRESENTIE